MQKYKTQKVLNKRKNIEEFIVDETLRLVLNLHGYGLQLRIYE
jgi:hypothetical protein